MSCSKCNGSNVDKDASSDEYRRSRDKNNEQVRRSRAKKLQIEKFIEHGTRVNDKKIKFLEGAIHHLVTELSKDKESAKSKSEITRPRCFSYSKQKWHGDPI